MLENILKLSQVTKISKDVQQQIKGGFDPRVPCQFAEICSPDQVWHLCECVNPDEI